MHYAWTLTPGGRKLCYAADLYKRAVRLIAKADTLEAEAEEARAAVLDAARAYGASPAFTSGPSAAPWGRVELAQLDAKVEEAKAAVLEAARHHDRSPPTAIPTVAVYAGVYE